MSKYKVKFYKNSRTGQEPVLDYIKKILSKDRVKVNKYIDWLRQNNGYLDEPYSRHIRGKLRELKVDFGWRRHRIFYFTFSKQNIILLHAFTKRTQKTPIKEINKAIRNQQDVYNNSQIYE